MAQVGAIPARREKARIHNPLGDRNRSGTAFDSMGGGCARVVKTCSLCVVNLSRECPVMSVPGLKRG